MSETFGQFRVSGSMTVYFDSTAEVFDDVWTKDAEREDSTDAPIHPNHPWRHVVLAMLYDLHDA